MNEVLDVANAFGTPLKVAWIAWLAWGVGQAYWFKHERANAAAPRLARAPRAPRKAALKRDKVVAQPVGRLITPQHVAPKPQPAQPAAPVFEPVFEARSAQAFDPSKAVVETFDPRGASLDAIVADMEANMPRKVGRDASHIH
jgi:hypothetical protein